MSLESSFFNGSRRREISVENYQPLKSTGEERRKKLLIRDQLGESSLIGMPTWIESAYDSVAKNDAHADRCNMDPVLKGMTLEFYATEEGQHRALLLKGCTLRGFHVVRIGQEEKAKFFLYYIAYAPDSQALHDWLYVNYDMSAFATFDVDQSSLGFDPVDNNAEEPSKEEDNYEAQRREATSPEHDEEFGGHSSGDVEQAFEIAQGLHATGVESARTTRLVSVGAGRKRQTRSGSVLQ